MGREIRRVPPDWEHPKDDRGYLRPLFDRDYDTEIAEWTEGRRRWEAGQDPARAEHEAKTGHTTWEDWHGEEPDPSDYRPAWPDEIRTAYQVYENVSEGTPVSPVFATEAELLAWLTQPDGAPGLGIGGRALYLTEAQARNFIKAAWAPSVVMQGGVMQSGVAIHKKPQ